MARRRLQHVRGILTERLNAVFDEIFGEVESILEDYCEENNRLKNTLHMLMNPEIKLTRIDVHPHPGAHAERPLEENSQFELEVSEPPTKKPKEELIETEIDWESEQQQVPGEAAPDCVKTEAEEEDASITDLFQINVVDYSTDSSATLSDEEANSDQRESFSEFGADSDCSQALRGDEAGAENQERRTRPASSKMNKNNQSLQKTMLKFPRIMPYKPFMPPPPDCRSFFENLKEAFADFPDDKKPLITTIDFTSNVELVDSALGQVPKGCPLSYHFPLPSSQDFTACDDAPPRPQLPLAINSLEPADLSALSAEDHERVSSMQITWEAAHHLELSTRECKESVEELRKMRLTYRFKEIYKLQPGRKHAEDLIFKLLKGPPRSKMAQIEEELKTEALREYCRHLCVNWYPCGLVVHPGAPWLGATPHGLVYDPTEQERFGLVHIKCVMLPSFADSNFVFVRNGALQLKRHHLSYWHIQGEMMVTGTTWCDLLVYSREDILVQRIYRDTANIKDMKEKLDEFFFSYYLQSFFTNTNR